MCGDRRQHSEVLATDNTASYLLLATVHICVGIDDNTASYLAWAHVNRWLGVRLDFLGAVITGIKAIFCI
jgi:hypothetical protein